MTRNKESIHFWSYEHLEIDRRLQEGDIILFFVLTDVWCIAEAFYSRDCKGYYFRHVIIDCNFRQKSWSTLRFVKVNTFAHGWLIPLQLMKTALLYCKGWKLLHVPIMRRLARLPCQSGELYCCPSPPSTLILPFFVHVVHEQRTDREIFSGNYLKENKTKQFKRCMLTLALI